MAKVTWQQSPDPDDQNFWRPRFFTPDERTRPTAGSRPDTGGPPHPTPARPPKPDVPEGAARPSEEEDCERFVLGVFRALAEGGRLTAQDGRLIADFGKMAPWMRARLFEGLRYGTEHPDSEAGAAVAEYLRGMWRQARPPMVEGGPTEGGGA